MSKSINEKCVQGRKRNVIQINKAAFSRQNRQRRHGTMPAICHKSDSRKLQPSNDFNQKETKAKPEMKLAGNERKE